MERAESEKRGRVFAHMALAALLSWPGCGLGPGSPPAPNAGEPEEASGSAGSGRSRETVDCQPPAPARAKEPESPRTRLDLGRALDLLASWQRQDGLWAGTDRPGAAPPERDAAFTALALLSFGASGCTPNHGPRKRSLQRGLSVLVARLQTDGSPPDPVGEMPGIFTEAVIAWVLLEQAQRSRSATIARAADAALLGLLKREDGKGSWRSSVDDHDIVFTAWAVLALRSACEFENLRARDALERAYGFLLAQLGPDGRVDPWREDAYFARAFGKGLPPRRIQLLSAAALAGIARVRGKSTLAIEPVRLGFTALDLDFPPTGETVWAARWAHPSRNMPCAAPVPC
jgi:hypothetical protein